MVFSHRKEYRWAIALLCLTAAFPALAIDIGEFPIVTPQRLELTRVYAKHHYGLDGHSLSAPKMVVVHYTVVPTLEGVIGVFRPDRLASHRKDIRGHGEVNVGVHFVVDRDGKIYRLLPTDVMGRHTIGFNHVALGIENIAADANALTERQLEANAVLVKWLKARFPSIVYLIGHHEYMRKDLPHFRLFRELDRSYRPTVKSDPGGRFMTQLRIRLKESGVELQE